MPSTYLRTSVYGQRRQCQREQVCLIPLSALLNLLVTLQDFLCKKLYILLQVVSPTHRRALQLSPADFQSNFRLEDTSILQEIAQFAKPWPGKEVTATLTALNVYGPGDHFKQHQDTPFRDKGFGTLVIALPNVYKGRLQL